MSECVVGDEGQTKGSCVGGGGGIEIDRRRRREEMKVSERGRQGGTGKEEGGGREG